MFAFIIQRSGFWLALSDSVRRCQQVEIWLQDTDSEEVWVLLHMLVTLFLILLYLYWLKDVFCFVFYFIFLKLITAAKPS